MYVVHASNFTVKTTRSRRVALAFAKSHAGREGACVHKVSLRTGAKTIACFLPGGKRTKRKTVPAAWRKIGVRAR